MGLGDQAAQRAGVLGAGGAAGQMAGRLSHSAWVRHGAAQPLPQPGSGDCTGIRAPTLLGNQIDFMPTTNIVHHGSKKMSFTRFDQVIFSGSTSNVAIGQSVWCSANRNALIFISKMRKPKCTSQRQSHMQCSCWPRHRNKSLTNSVPLPENWQRASSRACLPIPARCARSARRSPRPQTFGLMHSKQGSRPSRNLPRTSFPLAMALRGQRRES